MKPIVRLAALMALGMCLLGVSPVFGAQIQVGYADDLRPTPFFPGPWAGGAGVALFAGTASNIDSAAVRIINNTGAAFSIQALTVDSFGDGASFSIWGTILGGGFSLAPGLSAIFTQTTQYNFDSSDNQGGNIFAIPRVTVTIDGVTTSLFDTAQVLNTEGTDHLAQAGLNESHQWRDIGTFGGQAGAPEPGTLALLGGGLLAFAGKRYLWKRRA